MRARTRPSHPRAGKRGGAGAPRAWACDDEEVTQSRDPKAPSSLTAARAGWVHRGGARPAFAVEPGEGQESVWDYPRPPALVADSRRVIVRRGEVIVADTRRALRLLETSHPPTWYLPRADIDMRALAPAGGGSFCEWKGDATYFDVVAGGPPLHRAAWAYPEVIDARYAALTDCIAFYATHLDCRVDGVRVRPQPGGFYGGWITPDLVGPFKGDPGTAGW
jgi:uncharacterized protein (DUF427 family)